MFADFRGRTVLIAGEGAITEAAIQAFTERGAECLRTTTLQFAGVRTAGARLEAFVWCAESSADIESALNRVCETFGARPRYLVAVVAVVPAGDRTAIDAAMIAAWCGWAAVRYAGEMSVNVVRYRALSRHAEPLMSEHFIAPACEVASAIVALCSGAMDAVRGQTLIVDRGAGFCDNAMRLYAERERRGL